MLRHFGGSFAPPLDAAKLDAYRELAADSATPPAVADAMQSLIRMVEVFQETPPSKNGGTPHPSGRGTVVPLEDAEVKRIRDHVPWPHEAKAIQELFDTIPPEQKALRDAAFHLCWYANELTADREPLTTDRL